MASKLLFIELGNFSNEYYINRLQELVLERYGFSNYIPEIQTMDFDALNQYLPNRYNQLLPLLNPLIQKVLIQLYAQILLPNITLHLGLDQLRLEKQFKQRFVHPFVLAKKEINNKNVKKITIFGTRYAMQEGIFDNFFNLSGIHITHPNVTDSASIDEIRLEVSENGSFIILV